MRNLSPSNMKVGMVASVQIASSKRTSANRAFLERDQQTRTANIVEKRFLIGVSATDSISVSMRGIGNAGTEAGSASGVVLRVLDRSSRASGSFAAIH